MARLFGWVGVVLALASLAHFIGPWPTVAVAAVVALLSGLVHGAREAEAAGKQVHDLGGVVVTKVGDDSVEVVVEGGDMPVRVTSAAVYARLNGKWTRVYGMTPHAPAFLEEGG